MGNDLGPIDPAPHPSDLDVRSVGVRRTTLVHRRPITTARGTVCRRDVVVLAVVDGDGRTGLGEAAPLTGFTPETVDQAEAALRRWANDGTMPAGSPTARAAIDGALLALAADRSGLPLHHLLVPESPGTLPVTALVDAPDVEALADAGRRAVADGHPGVKVKVGVGPFADDLARVAAVREAIGDARLRLDANGAWSAAEAVDRLSRLAEYRPEFVEEPTAGLHALASVRAASPVPVAVDESATDLVAIDRALAVGAGDVLVVKPSALGGPLPTSEVVRRASDAGVGVVVTSLMEGSIGIRSAAHLAAAFGLIDPAPGLATAALLAEDSGDPLLPVDGTLVLT